MEVAVRDAPELRVLVSEDRVHIREESGFARVLVRTEEHPNEIDVRRKAGVELQDRVRADRDRVAKELNIEATLIANRAQLALIARSPRKLDDALLPWQADLLRNEPSLKGI